MGLSHVGALEKLSVRNSFRNTMNTKFALLCLALLAVAWSLPVDQTSDVQTSTKTKGKVGWHRWHWHIPHRHHIHIPHRHKPHKHTPVDTLTGSYGGNGGGARSGTCPEGQWITSWYIRTGALVDQVRGKCSGGGMLATCGGNGGGDRGWRQLSTTEIGVRTGRYVDKFAGLGGNGGGAHSLNCGSLYRIHGYNTRCGALVDRIQLKCRLASVLDAEAKKIQAAKDKAAAEAAERARIAKARKDAEDDRVAAEAARAAEEARLKKEAADKAAAEKAEAERKKKAEEERKRKEAEAAEKKRKEAKAAAEAKKLAEEKAAAEKAAAEAKAAKEAAEKKRKEEEAAAKAAEEKRLKEEAEAKAKQEAADKAAAEKAAAEAAAAKKAEEEAQAKLAAEEARIKKAAEALAAKQKLEKEKAEAAVLAEAKKISDAQKNNTAPVKEIVKTILACDHLLEQCLWMEDNADYR